MSFSSNNSRINVQNITLSGDDLTTKINSKQASLGTTINGYLSGLTSDPQTQINSKLDTLDPSIIGNLRYLEIVLLKNP